MKYLKNFENTIKEKELSNLCYFENEYNLEKIKNIFEEYPNINVNIQDDRGWTPLLIAINNDNWEIGKILLKKGADPNIFSYDDNSPMLKLLDSAILLKSQKPLKIINYWNFFNTLLPLVNLNKQSNKRKITPLIKAAELSNDQKNIKNTLYTTHSIAKFDDLKISLKILRKILYKKPDITLKDNNNKDFLDYLTDNIISILLSEFPNVEIYYNTKKYNL